MPVSLPGCAYPEALPSGLPCTRVKGNGSMSSTRSKDRDLIATTASLVEFLRDVAMARQKRVVDVSDYKQVLWFDGLPKAVIPVAEAGPGETLLTIQRHRPEAPPTPPAQLTGWIEPDDLLDSDLKEPPLKEQGSGWVDVRQPDGTLTTQARTVTRKENPGVVEKYYDWLPQWKVWARRDRARSRRSRRRPRSSAFPSSAAPASGGSASPGACSAARSAMRWARGSSSIRSR